MNAIPHIGRSTLAPCLLFVDQSHTPTLYTRLSFRSAKQREKEAEASIYILTAFVSIWSGMVIVIGGCWEVVYSGYMDK